MDSHSGISDGLAGVIRPPAARPELGRFRVMSTQQGPDLPGDAVFVPIVPGLHLNGKVAVSMVEQSNIHHNQMRYAELQKLRNGQPNSYSETRYR